MNRTPPHNNRPSRPANGQPGARRHSSLMLADDETTARAKLLTRARARDLGYLLVKYVRRHMPRRPKPERADISSPPRAVAAMRLKYLKAVPWLLGILFLVSLFWDFPGVAATVFGQELQFSGLLRILAVSGLIGFGTNWLAITMLFQPRERRPIFGQGLIPAQRERVIYRLAQAISKELINEQVIKERIEQSGAIQKYRDTALAVSRGVIEDPEFRQDIKELTAQYIDEVLQSAYVRQKLVDLTLSKLEQYAGQGIGGLALKAYRYFRNEELARKIDAAIRELPTRLDTVLDEMDRFLDNLPAKIEERSTELETWATRAILGFVETIDVHEIIISNMERYDEAQLENLLKHTSNEHFNYIKYLGGILGFFGGFVIWNPPIALIVFGTTGLSLYAADEMLFRRNARATQGATRGGGDAGSGL